MAAGKLQQQSDRIGAARQRHRVGQTGGEPFVAGMGEARGAVQAENARRQESLKLPQGGCPGRIHAAGGVLEFKQRPRLPGLVFGDLEQDAAGV